MNDDSEPCMSPKGDTTCFIAAGIPVGTECLLVVDDEPLIRSFASDMLSRMGYTVLLADDGEAAVKIYQDNVNKVDAVLLDIAMPNMDGHTCIQRLLCINPGVRVMFTSGSDMRAEAASLLAEGAKGVMQKPFRLRDLAVDIRRILDE